MYFYMKRREHLRQFEVTSLLHHGSSHLSGFVDTCTRRWGWAPLWCSSGVSGDHHHNYWTIINTTMKYTSQILPHFPIFRLGATFPESVKSYFIDIFQTGQLTECNRTNFFIWEDEIAHFSALVYAHYKCIK